MNTLFEDPNIAMQVAWDISKQTGRRVWRHQCHSKYGELRWLVSYEQDAQIALQELTV